MPPTEPIPSRPNDPTLLDCRLDSAFAWEAQALAWLRDRLPDSEAYRGWSNFEFVAHDGAVSEVALIPTPTKLLLIEIKSRPGKVQGDAGA